MKKAIYLLILTITALGLSGCGESEQSADKKPVKQKRFMEEEFQAIDKAKGLEKTLQDGADQQRKAIEDAGG